MSVTGPLSPTRIRVDHQGDLEMEYVPCDLCAADTPEPWFEARDTLLRLPYVFHIVRCRECGLAYLNPRPTRRVIGRFYRPEYYESFSSGRIDSASARRLFKAVYNRMTGRLAGNVEALPPGRVLDVGCGDGRYLSVFRERGWETFGVEPSQVAVDQAHALGLNVFLGGLTEAKLPTGSFDLVIMRYTIENMHNPSEVLAETSRVLKPGGRLFLCTVTIDSPIARTLGHFTSYIDAPRHLYLFTLKTLTQLLTKHGFHVTALRRVPTSGIAVGMFHRVGGHRLRRLIANRWVTRFLWLAELPLVLFLAYMGINRGNVELIAEKTDSRGRTGGA